MIIEGSLFCPSEVLNLYKSVSCHASDLRGIGIQLARLVKGSSSEGGALDAFLTKGKAATPTTPKKAVEESRSKTTPEKPATPSKSPRLAKTKSPLAKGSPAKRKKALGPSRQPETKTIKDFMMPRKKSPKKLDRDKFYLDFDVLAELPENLRHEILEEYTESGANHSEEHSRKDVQAGPLPVTPLPTTSLATHNQNEPTSMFDVSFSQVRFKNFCFIVRTEK